MWFLKVGKIIINKKTGGHIMVTKIKKSKTAAGDRKLLKISKTNTAWWWVAGMTFIAITLVATLVVTSVISSYKMKALEEKIPVMPMTTPPINVAVPPPVVRIVQPVQPQVAPTSPTSKRGGINDLKDLIELVKSFD